MATQGLISITRDGETVVKIVTGADGDKVVQIAEGENQRVAVANNQMILVDTEGEEVEISLLGPLLAVEFLSKLQKSTS